MTKTIDPTARVLQGIRGEYYIVREVAAKTGISESTLRRAIRSKTREMMPSKVVFNGKQPIYLYTPADIERIVAAYTQRYTPKDFDGDLPLTGRPRQFSDEERAERSRLHSKSNYWKKRAKRLREEGRDEEAAAAEAQYREIRKVLNVKRDGSGHG